MDRTRNIFIAIFGFTILASLALLMGLLWQDSQRLSAESAQFDMLAAIVSDQQVALTVAASITPPPTATTQPDRRATTHAEVAATTTAHPLALEEAKQWTILVHDSFDNNANNWETEAGDPELSLDKRQITDGVYSWDITSVLGFTWAENLFGFLLPDRFYTELEIDQREWGKNDQGLIFHYQDIDNFYLFNFCEEAGTVGIYRQVADVWYTLQNCHSHAAIQPDLPNKLAVIGTDNYYQFFINDQFVTDLWDDHFSQGEIGVYIEMNAEEQNIFYFDNLVIRSAELGR